MKSDKQVLYEAIRTSLTSSVSVFQRNNYETLFVKIRNRTEAGTPVIKKYQLDLEVV